MRETPEAVMKLCLNSDLESLSQLNMSENKSVISGNNKSSTTFFYDFDMTKHEETNNLSPIEILYLIFPEYILRKEFSNNFDELRKHAIDHVDSICFALVNQGISPTEKLISIADQPISTKFMIFATQYMFSNKLAFIPNHLKVLKKFVTPKLVNLWQSNIYKNDPNSNFLTNPYLGQLVISLNNKQQLGTFPRVWSQAKEHSIFENIQTKLKVTDINNRDFDFNTAAIDNYTRNKARKEHSFLNDKNTFNTQQLYNFVAFTVAKDIHLDISWGKALSDYQKYNVVYTTVRSHQLTNDETVKVVNALLDKIHPFPEEVKNAFAWIPLLRDYFNLDSPLTNKLPFQNYVYKAISYIISALDWLLYGLSTLNINLSIFKFDTQPSIPKSTHKTSRSRLVSPPKINTPGSHSGGSAPLSRFFRLNNN